MDKFEENLIKQVIERIEDDKNLLISLFKVLNKKGKEEVSPIILNKLKHLYIFKDIDNLRNLGSQSVVGLGGPLTKKIIKDHIKENGISSFNDKTTVVIWDELKGFQVSETMTKFLRETLVEFYKEGFEKAYQEVIESINALEDFRNFHRYIKPFIGESENYYNDLHLYSIRKINFNIEEELLNIQKDNGLIIEQCNLTGECNE